MTRKLVRFAVLLVCLSLTTSTTWAGQHTVTPSVGAQTAYDDNVLFRDVGSDVEFLVVPGLTYFYEAERSSVRLSGRANIFRYVDLTEFDREDQRYSFLAIKEFTERLVVDFNAAYANDFTFDEVLEEFGIVTDSSRRDEYLASPGLRLGLTEQDTLELRYSFNRVRYERQTFPDTDTHDVSATWSRLLSDERTSLQFITGYQRADFGLTNNSFQQNIYRGLVGVRYRVEERLEAFALAGGSFVDSEGSSTRTNQVPDDRVTLLADIGLTYSVERWQLNLEYNRSDSASVFGEIVTLNQFTFRVSHDLTERLRATFEARYRRSNTGSDLDELSQFYSVSPGLSYQLLEHTVLSLGYQYSRTNSENVQPDLDIVTDSEDRNRAFLRLDFAFPTTL